ncbi:hypothetical protein AAFF_G00068110 [Aldrovandia affinis]|uniref:Uncharacterized protein n=1 Tax=Aldrovandia affinis TaxID=143900 RepID=A0AAD7RZE1_9TELE|nr:hypothetical protein AAFF_G00068110 [Aldrovandia affinis]
MHTCRANEGQTAARKTGPDDAKDKKNPSCFQREDRFQRGGDASDLTNDPHELREAPEHNSNSDTPLGAQDTSGRLRVGDQAQSTGGRIDSSLNSNS